MIFSTLSLSCSVLVLMAIRPLWKSWKCEKLILGFVSGQQSHRIEIQTSILSRLTHDLRAFLFWRVLPCMFCVKWGSGTPMLLRIDPLFWLFFDQFYRPKSIIFDSLCFSVWKHIPHKQILRSRWSQTKFAILGKTMHTLLVQDR